MKILAALSIFLFSGKSIKAQNNQKSKMMDTPQLVLVDKFIVPKLVQARFETRMNFNRAFIKNLEGFISDEVFKVKLDDDNIQYLTIARWENQESLSKAKEQVQQEYHRISFNPADFTQQNNIQMERQVFFATYSMPKLKVLVFGKNTSKLEKVLSMLKTQNFQVQGTTDEKEGIKLLETETNDVLVIGSAAMASDLGEALIEKAGIKGLEIIEIDKGLVDRVIKNGPEAMEIYYLGEVIPKLRALEMKKYGTQ